MGDYQMKLEGNKKDSSESDKKKASRTIRMSKRERRATKLKQKVQNNKKYEICPACGIKNPDNAECCQECGFGFEKSRFTEDKLSLLGFDGHSTILKDGSVSKMGKSGEKTYRFRFGTKEIAYYIEESRIIQRVLTGPKGEKEIKTYYLPYEDIFRVYLSVGKESTIRISTYSGCLYLSTNTREKAISFVDMIEVASARCGHFFELNIIFNNDSKQHGGGMVGVGFIGGDFQEESVLNNYKGGFNENV